MEYLLKLMHNKKKSYSQAFNKAKYQQGCNMKQKTTNLFYFLLRTYCHLTRNKFLCIRMPEVKCSLCWYDMRLVIFLSISWAEACAESSCNKSMLTMHFQTNGDHIAVFRIRIRIALTLLDTNPDPLAMKLAKNDWLTVSTNCGYF